MSISRNLLLSLRCVVHKQILSRRKVITPTARFLSEDVQIRCLDDIEVKTPEMDPFSAVSEVQRPFLDELAPPVKRSFNLAAYVNRSETLQRLLELGVSLFDVEHTNPDAAKNLLTLNFERDCAPYIKFLVDNGLKEQKLGEFLSNYPSIFREHLEDLQARLNYLESKKFTKIMIARALNNSSHIISHTTKKMDFQLGKLQVEFVLPAAIIRDIVVRYPSIIALPYLQYKMVNFVLKDEFGFRETEIHQILRVQPQVLDILRPILIERLELVHNQIGLSHETIAKFPELITGPRLEICHRFGYLKKLHRNQFDPSEPLYVPVTALYQSSDEEFCRKYAKTSLDDYKLYLRSL